MVLWAWTKYIEANGEGEDEDDDLTDDLPEDADYGFFQPVFQPLYPEWQKRFALPQKESRAGVYVFKVGFAPHYGPATVWRRLALPHKATLAVLGKAILKAFKLDPEDGYELSYADGAGKTRRYGDPDRGRPPFADEMALGNCDLAPNPAVALPQPRLYEFRLPGQARTDRSPGPQASNLQTSRSLRGGFHRTFLALPAPLVEDDETGASPRPLACPGHGVMRVGAKNYRGRPRQR